MLKNNLILKLIILLINIELNCLCIEHPPYQVSIWMKGKSTYDGKHLCNGAIIHERLILTTAECLQSKVIGTNIVNQLLPKMIYIVAGSLNSPSKQFIKVNVSSIDVAKDFNLTTLENDLSILHLNESLPLDNRNDVKWILLDDHHDIQESSCSINTQNPDSPANIIQQTHQVQIFNNQNCTNSTSKNLTLRKNDICSLYVLSPDGGNICNKSEDDVNSSSDRGTALICDSKLIGLLSYIIIPHNNNINNNVTCTKITKLNAIYTKVATYLNWIYEQIAIESVIDGKLNHSMSPPYAASAPSPNISEMPSGGGIPPIGIPSGGIPNMPEHDQKSTTIATSISSGTSLGPHHTTTAHGSGSTTIHSVTTPSSATTQHVNHQTSKPSVSKPSSAIKLNSFNSMFAITLILVFSWFHK